MTCPLSPYLGIFKSLYEAAIEQEQALVKAYVALKKANVPEPYRMFYGTQRQN